MYRRKDELASRSLIKFFSLSLSLPRPQNRSLFTSQPNFTFSSIELVSLKSITAALSESLRPSSVQYFALQQQNPLIDSHSISSSSLARKSIGILGHWESLSVSQRRAIVALGCETLKAVAFQVKPIQKKQTTSTPFFELFFALQTPVLELFPT